MKEVSRIVSDLPNGKSSGFDGLSSESLKHADPLVCLLLSICFTCMFTHSYMPSPMIKSIIVPLVKNKSGNLADKNNYRPIALSSIASKVFEHLILCRLEEYLWTNDNQFRFKPSHSTDLCVYALTEFIEYFKSRSTSIYVAFLDASKAFDKISHCTYSTSSSIKKLKASYNGVLRRLLLIVKPYRASEMFVTHGIPSFLKYFGNVYTVSKSAYIDHSSNKIIKACLSPIAFIHSPIRQWWRSVLY